MNDPKIPDNSLTDRIKAIPHKARLSALRSIC